LTERKQNFNRFLRIWFVVIAMLRSVVDRASFQKERIAFKKNVHLLLYNVPVTNKLKIVRHCIHQTTSLHSPNN